jgi:sulfur carrier protein ThiS
MKSPNRPRQTTRLAFLIRVSFAYPPGIPSLANHHCRPLRERPSEDATVRIQLNSAITDISTDPTGKVLIPDGSSVGDLVELALGHRDASRVAVTMNGTLVQLHRELRDGDTVFLSNAKTPGA